MNSEYHPIPPHPTPAQKWKKNYRNAETGVFPGAELATLCKNNLNQNR